MEKKEILQEIEEELNDKLGKSFTTDYIDEAESYILFSEDFILTVGKDEKIIVDFYLNLSPDYVAFLSLSINDAVRNLINTFDHFYNLEIGDVFNFDDKGNIEFNSEAEEIENNYMNEYVKTKVNKALFLDRLLYSDIGYEC